MSANNGVTKERLGALKTAHAGYEKCLADLARVKASGDDEKLLGVLKDLSLAEAAVSTARASVLISIDASANGNGKAATKASAKPAKAKPAAKVAPKKTMKTVGSGFSGWLKAVRTGIGLTQAAFGEKVGASYTQMFAWEKGLRLPSDDYVSKIERLVGKTCPHRKAEPVAAAS